MSDVQHHQHRSRWSLGTVMKPWMESERCVVCPAVTRSSPYKTMFAAATRQTSFFFLVWRQTRGGGGGSKRHSSARLPVSASLPRGLLLPAVVLSSQRSHHLLTWLLWLIQLFCIHFPGTRISSWSYGQQTQLVHRGRALSCPRATSASAPASEQLQCTFPVGLWPDVDQSQFSACLCSSVNSLFEWKSSSIPRQRFCSGFAFTSLQDSVGSASGV